MCPNHELGNTLKSKPEASWYLTSSLCILAELSGNIFALFTVYFLITISSLLQAWLFVDKSISPRLSNLFLNVSRETLHPCDACKLLIFCFSSSAFPFYPSRLFATPSHFSFPNFYFFKHLFCLKCRILDREKRERWRSFFIFPYSNGRNSQDWARLNPEAWSFIRVSHLGAAS